MDTITGGTSGATTADITEYNLAKDQGYTGTFLEWLAEASAAGRSPVGGTTGTTATTPTTDIDKAIDKVAQNIISLEKSGTSSSANYWSQVNALAKKQGIDADSADKMIIKQIQAIKGETAGTFKVPAGYEKIDGAKYSTGAAQKAAYDDIQIDPTGKFLYGKPKTATTTTQPSSSGSQTTDNAEKQKFLKDLKSYKEMITKYNMSASQQEQLKQVIINQYGMTKAEVDEMLKLI